MVLNHLNNLNRINKDVSWCLSKLGTTWHDAHVAAGDDGAAAGNDANAAGNDAHAAWSYDDESWNANDVAWNGNARNDADGSHDGRRDGTTTISSKGNNRRCCIKRFWNIWRWGTLLWTQIMDRLFTHRCDCSSILLCCGSVPMRYQDRSRQKKK